MKIAESHSAPANWKFTFPSPQHSPKPQMTASHNIFMKSSKDTKYIPFYVKLEFMRFAENAVLARSYKGKLHIAYFH